ncbi:MAG: amidohydrolase [Chloroflexi bacterium]|nr:amidohydrolase [Chloroflexota bacterium]
MIVDFHTHIFPPWLIEQRERYLQRDATFAELFADPKAKMATAEDLVEAMDEDGVDRSVAMGIGWTDQGVAREVNDYIIESVRRYPQRIVGFGGISPTWGSDAVHEAERCADEGLRGIGELHPDLQGYDIGDERTMAPLMELARRRGLIVTTHSSEPVGHTYAGKGETTPAKLWRFVRSFPDNTIVCAHWGGGLPFYALMPEVAEGLANVYFDSAASPFLYRPEVFGSVKGLIGAEHILMGSDFPLLRARRLLTQVEESGLSEDDKAAILGGNAERLLTT